MTHIFKNLMIGSTALMLMAGGIQTAYASSIGVEPLFLEVAPTQSAAIRVRNTSQEDIPVEVLVFKRDIDANGTQTRIPADDDFIIFPPQASLKAAGTQVFRLRPLDGTKTQSESYFVSFRQVPAPLAPSEENGARIQVVFSFDAAVHVVPRKAKGNAILKTAKASSMVVEEVTGEVKSLKNGRQVEVTKEVTVPAVEIEIENDGNKYLYLHEQEITATITEASGETSIHKWINDGVSKHVKVTLVEPNEARIFTLPLPKDVNPTQVDVSVRQRRKF